MAWLSLATRCVVRVFVLSMYWNTKLLLFLERKEIVLFVVAYRFVIIPLILAFIHEWKQHSAFGPPPGDSEASRLPSSGDRSQHDPLAAAVNSHHDGGGWPPLRALPHLSSIPCPTRSNDLLFSKSTTRLGSALSWSNDLDLFLFFEINDLDLGVGWPGRDGGGWRWWVTPIKWCCRVFSSYFF
jgi:hypothetical protein